MTLARTHQNEFIRTAILILPPDTLYPERLEFRLQPVFGSFRLKRDSKPF